MKFKKTAAFFLLIFLALGFILFFYHKVAISPNSYLFSSGGDGIKNYYSYLYHIKNDSSYAHFEGLNYPYGDVHIYSDGQPALSNPLRFIYSFYPGILDYSVGIVNWLMIMSFLIAAIFLYLILQKLRLPLLYSVFGALGIMMLAPQVFRLVGHYGLSYACFFPVTWYLLIRFFEAGNKWIWTILIISSNLVWVFLHPYLGMISSFFLLFYWLVWFIQNRKTELKKVSNYLHAILQSTFALLTFKTIVSLLDFHEFRTTTPWGMFAYNARAETVFIPNHVPFRPLVEIFWEIKGQVWEGWSYIGISAVLIVFLSVYKIFRYIRSKNYRLILNPVLPDILKPAIWASVLVLLISMAYPYKLYMHFLLDWFPFLKQFRGLGRFAWVFYYVVTVYSLFVIHLIYRYLKWKKLTVFANAIIFVTLLFFFIESIPYHRITAHNITQEVNLFDKGQLDQNYLETLSRIDRNQFQAIIPLPFYHIGSENFDRHAEHSMKPSQLISYYSGLPLMSALSARVSMVESKNIIQLLSPSFIKKEIEPDLPGKKPFLVLFCKGELTANEQALMAKATKIYDNELLELYILEYAKLFESNATEEFQNFENIQGQLEINNGFFVSDTAAFIHFDNFDESLSGQVHTGKGAVEGRKKNYTTIWEMQPGSLVTGITYEASFWYYNKGESRNQILVAIEERDEHGNSGWPFSADVKSSEIINGNWSLVSIKFNLSNAGSQLKLFLKGDDRSDQEIYIDDLLIRPADVNVYKILERNERGEMIKLFKNNLFIEKPSVKENN